MKMSNNHIISCDKKIITSIHILLALILHVIQIYDLSGIK